MTLKLKDPSLLVEACLIDGEFVGTPALDVTDPSTGAIVGRVPLAGTDDTTRAVEAAERALPAWKRLLAKERSRLLRRWYELMIENRDDLALIMTAEQGKPLAEAAGEIDYAAGYVEFYAEEAKRIAGETLPSPRDGARVLVIREASGVVAAITPWNFPAAMITRKVAPALAAGCTAVVKPASETPLTALALARLAVRAGLPNGVLNVVTGKSSVIGEVLTGHPAVRVVSFTGSTDVGKKLIVQCAGTVKKVYTELGGNAPFIVFDDADLDAAVEGAMASKFRNMGQTCVCANRIYAQAGIHDAFVEKLTAAVRALKLGDGRSEGVTQGPLVNPKAVEKVEAHVADALARGAKVVTGGARSPLGGSFFEPTVLTGVTADMAVAREETFGPLAPVFRFETEDEAIRLANDTEFGLASYFYAQDVGRIFRVAEGLQAGMVGINSGAISSELVPFGGVKESGNGREGSHHGIDEYVEKKYLLIAGLDR
ncbi:NAD-dependent succinate-semialdehyde dehydrogenase [Pleomorphomonas carboxyditropha]|uniref:Succinate-semialdehyde dehydrogenase (NADP(+)) n=1 Tax=Pleomorphomonas carboxyditropha TaxID=2023338 RepID=A0A2G9WT57_9HYPH|nr:NAD-dependent succinate-semialdehyde dehydrogenase [Pleomorphomonas carboxyditropha]PIO97855.1 succinate-semialdehyde dehydrogenase (NADP(+)) [Pleomorphomonas carboxyditropha]